jgi:hypothetical protein
MRARTVLLVILGPAFVCWWGGFLLLDAGVRELPGAVFVVWAVAVTLVVAWLGTFGVARKSSVGRPRRALTVAAFLVAWVLLSVGGWFFFALLYREGGPAPYVMLPLLFTSLASVVLGLKGVATEGPVGARLTAWALAGLLGVQVLLTLFTVVGVSL